jgi:hypothetical protein
VAWLLPELDVGVDDGELSPDDELPDDVDELELPEPVLLDGLELEFPVPDLACCVLVADDPAEVWVAADATPGRLTATAPAAARLAAAAEIVATRSRLRPRSRSAMAGDTPRDGMLCLLMPGVLPPAFGWRSRLPLSNL